MSWGPHLGRLRLLRVRHHRVQRTQRLCDHPRPISHPLNVKSRACKSFPRVCSVNAGASSALPPQRYLMRRLGSAVVLMQPAEGLGCANLTSLASFSARATCSARRPVAWLRTRAGPAGAARAAGAREEARVVAAVATAVTLSTQAILPLTRRAELRRSNIYSHVDAATYGACWWTHAGEMVYAVAAAHERAGRACGAQVRSAGFPRLRARGVCGAREEWRTRHAHYSILCANRLATGPWLVFGPHAALCGGGANAETRCRVRGGNRELARTLTTNCNCTVPSRAVHRRRDGGSRNAHVKELGGCSG
jgi:hypothetical protein